MLVRSASLTSPVASLHYRKKTSGTDIRRTPDVKLRLVGYITFVDVNFREIKLLKLVVVMVRSYSFGHVNSVK